MRVLRIPYSTNVDRVALALGHKGLAVEWVDVDPADRSPVRALSGQDLVPVLQLDDGSVVVDSRDILRRLEADHPDPPLWPADPAARAQAEVFAEWFDEVWKGPPNRLAARGAPGRAGSDSERLHGWTGRFERLLADGRPFLLGGAVTVADVLTQPFLRYGAVPLAPGDDDPFHAVLVEHVPIRTGAYPRLRAWVARVDALPRS